MKFQLDHDLHIHTYLSPCSNDPEQNPQSILRYGEENGLRHIVLTDHFWDEAVPGNFAWQGWAHISKSLPLPQGEHTRMHIGCEVDMNRNNVIGISRELAEKLEFFVVSINHLHIQMKREEHFDKAWYKEQYLLRWRTLLDSGLPYHKIGFAHPTFRGLAGNLPNGTDHIDILDSIPDSTFRDYFGETQRLGMGVEINVKPSEYGDADLERILRVYRIAAECGCHFYGATDAHFPRHLAPRREGILQVIDMLGLTEDQKFRPFGD